MAVHIDVVRNEPLAGIQRRIATLVADGDDLVVLGDDQDAWRGRIERLVGPSNGHRPDEYLAAVVERLSEATYVWATEVHSDADCPFMNSEEVDIAAVPAKDFAGA